MTIALDVGTRRFRALKVGSGELVAKTCATTCAFLPDKPHVRRLLETAQTRFLPDGDQLVIWGESAASLARRCAIKTEHLLARNPLRKQKQTIIRPLDDVLDLLLPSAQAEEVCCIGSLSDDLHADWLMAAVAARGYRIVVCSAGLAAVLAELVEENFTGIAMVFGGSRCEAVLANNGEEFARYELPRAGDAIDQSLAILEDRYWWSMSGFRELETDGITEWKESLTTKVTEPAIPRAERLLTGYEQLVSDLVAGCESRFDRHPVSASLPVVVSGGAARIPGFLELMSRHLRESYLPIHLKDVRLATAEYTIARGLLIQAERAQRKQVQSDAA
jgi:hypothetical protein